MSGPRTPEFPAQPLVPRRPAALALWLALGAAPAVAQAPVWLEQIGDQGSDSVEVAVPDGQGGVLFGGNTDSALIGAQVGQRDGWLARHDAAGDTLWATQFGGVGFDVMLRASADGSGGALACGFTTGAFAGANAGGIDAWFAHFDAQGQELWRRQIGNPQNQYATGVAADGSGGMYVGGRTFGFLGAPSAGGQDA
jgi:hypothetical protein